MKKEPWITSEQLAEIARRAAKDDEEFPQIVSPRFLAHQRKLQKRERWLRYQKAIIACWAFATLMSLGSLFIIRDYVSFGFSLVMFASCAFGLYADVSKYRYIRRNP